MNIARFAWNKPTLGNTYSGIVFAKRQAASSCCRIENHYVLVQVAPQTSWPTSLPADRLQARSLQPGILSQESSVRSLHCLKKSIVLGIALESSVQLCLDASRSENLVLFCLLKGFGGDQ